MPQAQRNEPSISRRQALGLGAAAAALSPAAAQAQRGRSPRPRMWKPKLGVLGKFAQSNLDFCTEEGFTSIGLWANRRSSLDMDSITDEQIAKVKAAVAASGLHLSAAAVVVNHTAADPDERKRENEYFVKVINLAAELGTPYVGTVSGFTAGVPFEKQVDEVVRVYEEKYFPLCEKYKLKILWEPWPGPPTRPVNLATGPVGFEALFKAFNDSPFLGLRYDPSHLVWQMMDPIQAARDFVDKIYEIDLKDTEILWHLLQQTGINPPNGARWWRFRLPGLGAVDWPAFFGVLMEAGYTGAMNIEHEDRFYGWPYRGNEFSEAYREGFRMAHRYLRQFVPEEG